jgi:hypothetical protein
MPRFSYLARSTTLRAAAAVAALAVTVPVAGATAAPSSRSTQSGSRSTAGSKPQPIDEIRCTRSKNSTNNHADWQVFPSPHFSVAVSGSIKPVSQDVDSYAVDPRDPNRIVASNQNSIQLSRDGGCTWFPSLRLDDIPSDPRRTPMVGAINVIKGLYISPSGTVYATVEELETGKSVGRPHVIRSSTGGPNTWDLGDTGLPPLGHPLTLRASRTNPKVMYLSFSAVREDDTTTGGTPCPPAPLPCPGGGSTPQSPPGLLWGSTDGGATWSARTDPQDVNGASAIKYFSIEDNDPSGNTLWVVANGALRKSVDGGRTFALPDGLNQSGFTFTAVETIDKGDNPNPIELVAFGTGNEMIRRVNGRWLRSYVFFHDVESVAQLPDGEIAIATSPANGDFRVYRIFRDDFRDYEEKLGLGGTTFRATFGWEEITPKDAQQANPRISSGDAGPAKAGTFYLRDRRQLLRFLGSRVRKDRALVPPSPIGAPPPPRGTITPRILTMDLPLGKTKTVDYTLTLPPAPTPIDVYLLLDNSGSMEPLISDLKQSLGEVAKRLVASGVDVNMGVGQINVQPDPGAPPVDNPRTPDVDEGKARPLYERLRAIGAVDANLFQELNRVDGNGGSGSEAQLESLWQSVTGEGLSTNAVPWLLGYGIPPGQEARFRSATSSIKVIVHATDEGFSHNIQGGHNDDATVIKALVNAGVLQIGLSQGVTEAASDLARIAKGTGAVAPAGGVDCDGDGRADILAGRALVCGQNYGLDVTLVNLLKSIADPQTITLRGSSTPTLANISRTSFAINAKQATHVTFKVTYSCVGLAPGGYVNDLAAGLRGSQIATAVATVNCGGVSTPPRVVPNPAEPQVQQPAPVPQPAVPAIAPVNPLPQAQSQVQTQINPQAGAADQEQEQLQVAAAENDITENEEELAMSRLDSRWSSPGPGLVFGAGLAMASALASGVALRRRTRTRTRTASAG